MLKLHLLSANITFRANGKASAYAESNSLTNAKANDMLEACKRTLLSPVVTSIFLLSNAPFILKVTTPPRQKQQEVLRTDMALSRRVSPYNWDPIFLHWMGLQLSHQDVDRSLGSIPGLFPLRLWRAWSRSRLPERCSSGAQRWSWRAWLCSQRSQRW